MVMGSLDLGTPAVPPLTWRQSRTDRFRVRFETSPVLTSVLLALLVISSVATVVAGAAQAEPLWPGLLLAGTGLLGMTSAILFPRPQAVTFTTELTESTLVISSPGTFTAYDWSFFTAISNTRTFVVFMRGDAPCCYVPKAAFLSKDDERLFFETAATGVRRSQEPDTASSRDIPAR